MEDARRAARDRRRVPPGLDPVARRLSHSQTNRRLADEPRQQADRVGAAADAGEGEVGQPPLDGLELRRRLVADPPLQVPHDRRVRMRAHRRPEHVVRRLDVRHPVAHRLVDRVLQRGRAARHRAHLGAQGVHPEHVRGLASDVLLAHEHHARQPEQGARRGGCDAVLAGAGLGDDAGLAEPSRQQRLSECVVDLVRTGVGEVFALEVEAESRDGDRRRAAATVRSPFREAPRLLRRCLGQAVGPVEGGRAAGETAEQVVAARPRTAGRGGPRRTRPRAARAPRRASRVRNARRSRAPSPIDRRRRPRAGRGARARGQRRRSADGDGRLGRAWRTGRPGTDPCADAPR